MFVKSKRNNKKNRKRIRKRNRQRKRKTWKNKGKRILEKLAVQKLKNLEDYKNWERKRIREIERIERDIEKIKIMNIISSCDCLDGVDYANDYDGVEDYVDDSEIVNCKKNNSRAILSIINT